MLTAFLTVLALLVGTLTGLRLRRAHANSLQEEVDAYACRVGTAEGRCQAAENNLAGAELLRDNADATAKRAELLASELTDQRHKLQVERNTLLADNIAFRDQANVARVDLQIVNEDYVALVKDYEGLLTEFREIEAQNEELQNETTRLFSDRYTLRDERDAAEFERDQLRAEVEALNQALQMKVESIVAKSIEDLNRIMNETAVETVPSPAPKKTRASKKRN